MYQKERLDRIGGALQQLLVAMGDYRRATQTNARDAAELAAALRSTVVEERAGALHLAAMEAETSAQELETALALICSEFEQLSVDGPAPAPTHMSANWLEASSIGNGEWVFWEEELTTGCWFKVTTAQLDQHKAMVLDGGDSFDNWFARVKPQRMPDGWELPGS